MSQPTISIITSSFNQSQYLKQLFACISMQKDENVEFIVVDAASTDGSLQLISKMRSLIDTMDVGPDRGPADGWRRGLSFARGKFVLFINADDVLLPKALDRIKDVIKQDTYADVFVAHGLIIDERVSKSKLFYSHVPRVETLARGIGAVCQQSTVMRRASLPPIAIENRTCWDSELLIDTIARGARTRRIEDVWGVFRMTDNSISGRAKTIEEVRRYASDRRKIADRYGVNDLLSVDVLRVNISRAQRYLDPDYYNLRRRYKYLESIKSVEELWPA